MCLRTLTVTFRIVQNCSSIDKKVAHYVSYVKYLHLYM